MSDITVLKFGGTSMGDEHTWRRVLDIIGKYSNPVVVVSATARTTRQLIAAAELAVNDYEQAISISREIRDRHRLLIENFMSNFGESETAEARRCCDKWIDGCIAELQDHITRISDSRTISARRKDAVASIGEKLSSRLFAECGSVYGFDTGWIDAGEIIRTDSDYGQANPDLSLIRSSVRVISESIEENRIPIMGGYYGSDAEGHTTTLGFEGSDYSASLVGAALDADGIEIWTDVSGIFTCDPRAVDKALPVGQLSYREATDLAFFGAKVLHPSTMKPASEKEIPIWVKNIFEPEKAGTKIFIESPTLFPAKAMAYLDNIVIITVTCGERLMGYEFLARIFRILNDFHASVDVVTTTEASVSVALEHLPRLDELLKEMEAIGAVDLVENQGLISLVGCRFEHTGQMAQTIFSCIPKSTLSMISFSRAKQNLNLVLPEDHLLEYVKTIHHSVFESSTGSGTP